MQGGAGLVHTSTSPVITSISTVEHAAQNTKYELSASGSGWNHLLASQEVVQKHHFTFVFAPGQIHLHAPSPAPEPRHPCDTGRTQTAQERVTSHRHAERV